MIISIAVDEHDMLLRKDIKRKYFFHKSNGVFYAVRLKWTQTTSRIKTNLIPNSTFHFFLQPISFITSLLNLWRKFLNQEFVEKVRRGPESESKKRRKPKMLIDKCANFTPLRFTSPLPFKTSLSSMTFN